VGILISGNSNTVSANTANDNSVGIGSVLSTDTAITRNTADGHGSIGIEVQYDVNASGQNDSVVANKAVGNMSGGTLSFISTYVNILRNQSNDNSVYGIAVQNRSAANTYDTISHDAANGNRTGAGITLVNDLVTTVTRNSTTGNGIDGIGS
jgi:nitrous oxidase accessory protein NosD